jgi:hypothetical protein
MEATLMGRRAWSLLPLLASAWLSACTSIENVDAPTQIMLRISAERALRDRLSELVVRVALREGNGFREPAQKRFAVADLVWPVDVPIVPRVPGDAFKEFEVVIDALAGDEVLAQARAISGFVPEQRRVLALGLFVCQGAQPLCDDPECSGDGCHVCASDGACGPVGRIDPNELAPLEGSAESSERDAGAPKDAAAGAPDAGQRGDAAATRDAAQAMDASAEAMPDAGTPGVSDGEAAEAALPSPSDGQVTGADVGPEPGPDDGGSIDAAFVPVRFSSSDREQVYTALSSDGLRIENRGDQLGNARSDRALQPGSGVFYFEAERLIATVGEYGIGIATAQAALASELGQGGASLGLYTNGTFVNAGAGCASFEGAAAAQRHYGVVVDYRGASPVLHVLLGSEQDATLACSVRSALSGPVYIFYSGSRYEVGLQLALNTGSDTTNFPFHYSPTAVRAALSANGEPGAAAALVFGFGQTRALPASAAPVLLRPADLEVAADTDVVLNGSASDAEDGDLTTQILWEDLSTLHHAPRTGRGGSFSFRAGLGRHPVRMSVRDSVGRESSAIVMVNAKGMLPPLNPVKLVHDELSDRSVNLDGSGLQIDFRAFQEGGLRANQAIYGQFWYFEAQRVRPGAASVSVGVMVREGKLSPLSIEEVPWCASLHMTGITAHNMNGQGGWDARHDHYGFAVDYQGEHPILHIIVGGAPGIAPYRVSSITLDDVWTPMYPFISGVALDDDAGSYDVALNFKPPFYFDPVNILGAGRNQGLKLGWGGHVPAF